MNEHDTPLVSSPFAIRQRLSALQTTSNNLNRKTNKQRKTNKEKLTKKNKQRRNIQRKNIQKSKKRENLSSYLVSSNRFPALQITPKVVSKTSFSSAYFYSDNYQIVISSQAFSSMISD